jgi:hypothetical protein
MGDIVMKHHRKLLLTGAAIVLELAAATASAQPSSCTASTSGTFPTDCSANSFMSMTAQTAQNTATQTQELAISYVNFLKITYNVNPTQAAAIVGNLMAESGGAQGLNSGWQVNNGSTSIGNIGPTVAATNYTTTSGIAGWSGSRKDGLIAFAQNSATDKCQAGTQSLSLNPSMPNSSQAANFGYLVTELSCDPTYSKAIPAIKQTSNLQDAVCSFEQNYESPQTNDYTTRLQMANTVMGWIGQPTSTSAGNNACSSAGSGSNQPPGNNPPPTHGSTSGPGGAPPSSNTIADINNDPEVAPYEQLIVQASQKYGVPAGIIAADIIQESSGNPNAVSDTGYVGLMQSGQSQSLTDPAASIASGTSQMAQMYSQYGSWYDVLAAYNGGPGVLTNDDPSGSVPGQGGTTAFDYANQVLQRACSSFGYCTN